jgi:hypothetical protein
MVFLVFIAKHAESGAITWMFRWFNFAVSASFAVTLLLFVASADKRLGSIRFQSESQTVVLLDRKDGHPYLHNSCGLLTSPLF